MYWQNSRFQILAFIVGACHTWDEAYRVCKNQLAERERAIWYAETEGKISRLIGRDKSTLNPIELTEIECYEEALRERDFYKELIERIQPMRKYAHLPDHEAFQACQREEWCLKLMTRAENYLASQGFIPPDQLEAMRQHPDFETRIGPHIDMVKLEMRDGLSRLPSRPVRALLTSPEILQ